MTRESTNTPYILTFEKWKMESNSLQPQLQSPQLESVCLHDCKLANQKCDFCIRFRTMITKTLLAR